MQPARAKSLDYRKPFPCPIPRANGIFILGSDVALAGVVVRDIEPTEADGGGMGIGAIIGDDTYDRANVRVTASLVERSTMMGVLVGGSDVELLGVVVRDTRSDEDGSQGHGISIQYVPWARERANVQITAAVVEQTMK